MMPTRPECLPCFLNQTLRAAAIMGLDRKDSGRLAARAAAELAGIDFNLSPPENSEELYRLIATAGKTNDPFAAVKEEGNRAALARIDAVTTAIENDDDPETAAISLAISGNVIDYGSHGEFDLDASIRSSLAAPPAIDHRDRLKDRLRRAKDILYLADNAGEIAFDRLLIEMIAAPVTVAVKSAPIINDALMADAIFCGIDRVAGIIENGSAIPGTVLDKCSPEFRQRFDEADLIISKGQGNFETLIGTDEKICHLMVVKCPLVAAHITETTSTECSLGDRIVMFDPGPENLHP